MHLDDCTMLICLISGEFFSVRDSCGVASSLVPSPTTLLGEYANFFSFFLRICQLENNHDFMRVRTG